MRTLFRTHFAICCASVALLGTGCVTANGTLPPELPPPPYAPFLQQSVAGIVGCLPEEIRILHFRDDWNPDFTQSFMGECRGAAFVCSRYRSSFACAPTRGAPGPQSEGAPIGQGRTSSTQGQPFTWQ